MVGVILLIGGEAAYLDHRLDGPWSMLVMASLTTAPSIWMYGNRPPNRSLSAGLPPPPVGSAPPPADWQPIQVPHPTPPPPPPPAPAQATEPGGRTETQVWSAPRRPMLQALAALVVLGGILWGVHAWGPLNPSVALAVQSDRVDVQGRPSFPIAVTNDSFSRVAVVGVTLRAVPQTDYRQELGSPDGRLLPTVAGLATGPGAGAVAPDNLAATPIMVGAHSIATLAVSLLRPACAGTVEVRLNPFVADLLIRTTVGRTFTESATLAPSMALTCEATEAPGTQPADPAGARAAIIEAFGIVYDNRIDPLTKAGRIDDYVGLDVASGQSLAGPSGDTVRSVRAEVRGVGFGRPDFAVVVYRLGLPDDDGVNSIIGDRNGQAVLIDGVWKVTRWHDLRRSVAGRRRLPAAGPVARATATVPVRRTGGDLRCGPALTPAGERHARTVRPDE